MAGVETFLPRILSIFYAVLDVRQGSQIKCQVPENLISAAREQPTSNLSFNSLPRFPGTDTIPPQTPPTTPASPDPPEYSPSLSIHVASPVSPPDSPDTPSRPRTSTSKSRHARPPLFYFEDISRYVIPASALCGRLVKCTTAEYRIIGFPVELIGPAYARREFRFNVCFVFEKAADLSCYEPLVRKIGRVLTACEEESAFLSTPHTSSAMMGIIEQLYEDLSSYAETSIPIDQFNSIELKLLPFYPNPATVKDWHVPVPLIDLRRAREPHWDLTVSKVCEYIDGVNHISRIAALADCDVDLARAAISHLLYYQTILISDIFAYSNMYTLRKSVQWLSVAPHVVEECGPYVTKPGKIAPEWPQLLHLYARLRPGLTVYDWIQEYEIHFYNIDVRRFLSFGVIKGFIRRVHRYPVLLSEEEYKTSKALSQGAESPVSPDMNGPQARSLDQALKSPLTSNLPDIPFTPHLRLPRSALAPDTDTRSTRSAVTPQLTPATLTGDQTPSATIRDSPRKKRTSAAENALERLFNRSGRGTSPAPPNAPPPSPLLGRALRPRGFSTDERVQANADSARRHSVMNTAPAPQDLQENPGPPAAPHQRRRSGSDNLGRSLVAYASGTASLHMPSRRPGARPPLRAGSTGEANQGNDSHALTTSRVTSIPPLHRSSSNASDTKPTVPRFPKELIALLDGSIHTDELGTRFEVGWRRLEGWLAEIGGGQGSGDLGRVVILYK